LGKVIVIVQLRWWGARCHVVESEERTKNVVRNPERRAEPETSSCTKKTKKNEKHKTASNSFQS
jgi:hypothetical protein